MPIDKIHESAVTQHGGSGCDIPVRVLDDNGTTARVITEGTGIHVKQGQVHTVPSSEVKPLR
jgi:hypothetical protein